ncbi:MAG: ABC transporter ATP-binding protein [Lysobacterales bacterium RIFOXYD1_FULL_69_11]|nr:MAG: ABC transporter ATP-binding protein [Xanthomonadales bacterium RIFOXYA1_FULL_69_10]OHE86121.1 MAG: ABC transporter ATP-binding protein [Xanthomonadales bacterium RIFOXYD1_FULL_69_11]
MRLEVDSAAVGYGARVVLAGVSFTLEPGEIGCLLGPSAAGKTTLLRAVAGFEPLLHGAIRGDATVLTGPGVRLPPERRNVGMVFQDHALLPHLDVLGNVRFGLFRQPRRDADARAREMLELVGLADAATRHPHELSGGQQQRVAVARALAARPRLVLLDEPFSSLDPELRERLALDVRAALKHEGVGALLVTHSQAEAFAMADRIGVVGLGRLQQWGRAYDLYHRPANRFVAGFVGEGVLLSGRADGDGRVMTPFGPVRPRDPAVGTGDEVDILLRPDDVIHDDDAPLQARIVARHFRGAEFLYTLELDDGQRVESLVPSHHDHAVGQRIGVRLDLEHVVVFAREGT